MTEQNGTTQNPRQPPEWQQALDELERSLMEASQAIARLRGSLNGTYRDPAPAAADAEAAEAPPAESEAPPAQSEGPPVGNEPGPAQREMAPSENEVAAPADRPGASAFDRLWERIEHERIERTGGGTPQETAAAARRGLDLLPQQYLMTVEDREGRVDMVPLHRALSRLRGVEDISLVSYANGVPVISVRAVGELDLDQLGDSISAAMDRECEVIPQDNGRVYLRMKARQD